jgi:hypothetical protein
MGTTKEVVVIAMTKRKGHLRCAIALYLTKEDVFITTK